MTAAAGSDGGARNGRGHAPEEIERELEATRSRVERDLDELRARFSPRALKARARGAWQGTEETLMETMKDATHTVTHKTRDVGNGLAGTVRDHPVSSALVALGVGLLAAGGAAARRSDGSAARRAFRRRGEDVERAWNDARAKGSEVGERAEEGAREVRRQAHEVRREAEERAAKASRGVGRWVTDHPLSAGALAAAGGVAVGLIIAGTRQEDGAFGDASRRVMDAARERAQDVAASARAGAAQARATASRELEEHDLTVSAATERIEHAAHDAREAAEESARRTAAEARKAAEAEAERRNLGSVDRSRKDG